MLRAELGKKLSWKRIVRRETLKNEEGTQKLVTRCDDIFSRKKIEVWGARTDKRVALGMEGD